MKKILMTAVAVSALSAGAASALTMTNASTVGGITVKVPTGAVAGYEPVTIASELVTSATTLTSTSFVFTPDTTVPAGTYVVTYTITGGKFKTSTVTPTGIVTGGGTSTPTISSSGDTQVVVSYVNTTALTSFTLASDIYVGTAKTPITISASVATPGGTQVDGGATAATTVLDYRSGFAFKATAANKVLTLVDSFKKFTGSSVTADLATVVGVIANDTYTALGVITKDLVYSDLVGTRVNPNTLISGISLKMGGDLSAARFRAYEAAGPTTVYADASTTDTITAASPILGTLKQAITTATVDGVDIPVAQTGIVGLATLATPVAGVESAYTITPTVTMATPASYAAPTFTAKAIGSVTYEGTTFYAPWFGDGSNGIGYTIRLSNSGTTAIPFVQLKLGSPFVAGTSGSVAGTANCSVGTIPAKGELLITSAIANACFGGFKRGDLTVITGNAGTAATTAKMRATAVNGTVTEVTLGTGAAAAALQPYN